MTVSILLNVRSITGVLLRLSPANDHQILPRGQQSSCQASYADQYEQKVMALLCEQRLQ